MGNYYIFNDELYHYGVKGMKWGVRRYQKKNGPRRKRTGKEIGVTAAKIVSPTGYALYKGIKKARNKRYNKSDYAKAKTLSDDELRRVTNRINLEQSYLQAVQKDKASRKAASQSVLFTYGSTPIRYIAKLPNDKEFKKKAAKKAAKFVGL